MPEPIDFPAEAQAALVEAWTLCDSALTEATLRFRPTNTYTPATGATVTTWGAEITGKKVLKWDEELKRPDTGDRRNEGQPARLTVTKVLVRDSDITPEVPAADSEFEMESARWKVASVERPPTGTFYVLTVRK